MRNLIIDQVISNVKPVTPPRNISHKSNTRTSPIDPLFHMNAFQLSFWGQNKRENCLHSSTCRIMTLVAQQLSKSVINHLQQPSGSWYLWMQLFLWTWNLVLLGTASFCKSGELPSFVIVNLMANRNFVCNEKFAKLISAKIEHILFFFSFDLELP